MIISKIRNYNVASDSHEYILFDVTIKNNPEEENKYSALDWALTKDNEEYIVYGIDPDNNLDAGMLNPGATKSGTFAFEIPLKTKGLKISYSIISNPDEKTFEFNITK